MPLIKANLKTGIKNLLSEMRAKEDVSDDEFAEKLSTAIHEYVKEITVTVNGVTTAGTAASQTQSIAVTAKIT